MPRNSHQLLFENKARSLILKGLRIASIAESAVPVSLDGRLVGEFQGLEVFERIGETASYPQLVADLVSNTYFRLTYQKLRGSGTFGTSVIGSVSFRPKGEKLILIPTVSRAEIVSGDPQRLEISIFGNYGKHAEIVSTRTYSVRAVNNLTAMTAHVTFKATSDIELEPATLGNDSFRLFTLSSMYSSSTRYDGNIIQCGSGSAVTDFNLSAEARRSGYLFKRPIDGARLAILKQTGSEGAHSTPGASDSPSIQADIVNSSVPLEELAAQVYLASTADINNDSLSAWIEWIKAPHVICTGTEISWDAKFTAVPPTSRS